MSRDSNTPRHARVCQRPSRRLQHAVVPVALGGLMAGSVWLAADAAAAPVPYHPCPDPSTQAGSPDAGPGGANTDRRRGDGWHSPGDHHHQGDHRYSGDRYSGDHHYWDGRHDQYGQRYADAQHDWRDHTGEHWYADHARVLVRRFAAQPHRATSTKPDAVAAVRTQAQQNDQRQASPQVQLDAARTTVHQHARPAHRPAPAEAPHSAANGSTNPAAIGRLSTSARSSLASADTSNPATDYVTLYGAIGGAALAALLGMGGVAVWRRRGADA